MVERAASGDFAGDTHKASPRDALRGAIERVPVAVMMARLGELDAEWAARVERLQAELVEMATRAGAGEADAANAKAVAEELRQDRDHWRALAERLATPSLPTRTSLIQRLATAIRRAAG